MKLATTDTQGEVKNSNSSTTAPAVTSNLVNLVLSGTMLASTHALAMQALELPQLLGILRFGSLLLSGPSPNCKEALLDQRNKRKNRLLVALMPHQKPLSQSHLSGVQETRIQTVTYWEGISTASPARLQK